ncbi:ABC transporter permease [Paenibacillus kobensis]|uniref:ABC transporter permease n=1 Tax=Paenibacillus kobensis TaxID=59841 RepID=UPI000FDA996E|nr:ABC transporter permease [Paenibacillus kobensis]
MDITMRRAAVAQFKVEMLRTLRNRRFVFFTIIMPIAFYFIFTSSMDSEMQVGGIDWSAYYLMSMAAYGVAGSGIMTLSQKFSKERSQGWARLLKITPLPSWAFVVSKVAAQAVINLFMIIILFIVAATVKGVDLSSSLWIESGLWIWFGSFSFMAIGTLVGTVRNADVVQVVGMIVYMSMSLLGGLWTPTETMSSTMQVIAHAMPTYWLGYEARNLIGGGTFDWMGVLVLGAYVIGAVILSSYIMKKQEAV